MRKTSSSGFTLIELLVVIAIIGILATLMFPAISGAIESANSTKVTNQGKSIATCIMTENMSHQDDGQTIWPGDAYDIRDNGGSVVKAVTKDTYQTSSDYFDDLLEYNVVEQLKIGDFAGAGVPQPSGQDKLSTDRDKYNLWCCVAVREGTVSGDPPFIFTRNLKPSKKGLSDNALLNNDDYWREANDVWTKSGYPKPFGTSRCIVVTRGGSARQSRSKDMKPLTFWGDAKFSKVDQVVALTTKDANGFLD